MAYFASRPCFIPLRPIVSFPKLTQPIPSIPIGGGGAAWGNLSDMLRYPSMEGDDSATTPTTPGSEISAQFALEADEERVSAKLETEQMSANKQLNDRTKRNGQHFESTIRIGSSDRTPTSPESPDLDAFMADFGDDDDVVTTKDRSYSSDMDYNDVNGGSAQVSPSVDDVDVNKQYPVYVPRYR